MGELLRGVFESGSLKGILLVGGAVWLAIWLVRELRENRTWSLEDYRTAKERWQHLTVYDYLKKRHHLYEKEEALAIAKAAGHAADVEHLRREIDWEKLRLGDITDELPAWIEEELKTTRDRGITPAAATILSRFYRRRALRRITMSVRKRVSG